MTDINDVTHERQVADLPEAQVLIHAICEAMRAYWDYLERSGVLFTDEEYPQAKCDALVATMPMGEYGTIDIALKGGALDRLYEDGEKPAG